MGGDSGPVVVVGAGHAGFHLAATLRQGGFGGGITLIDGQDRLPYQRPPLSKTYLAGRAAGAALPFRPEDFYREEKIRLVRGDPCVEVDRARRCVTTAGGARIGYRHLVLATGARPIALPLPGIGLEGVCQLRTWADADRARALLRAAGQVVVVGGGFIGLEAAAAGYGAQVTVVEAAERLMSRAVSPLLSRYCLEVQRSRGVEVRLAAQVTALRGAAGRVGSVELASGERLPADAVVVGVGVRPNVELAEAAGLRVADGIVVNECLETSDPRISAIGDCCAFPGAAGGRTVRLESVQNATDQARCVAARLLGDRAPYRDLPWFWSDQGDLKLQMAGVGDRASQEIVYGRVDAGRFSVLRFRDGRLVCGESVNSVGDHVALRSLVAHGAEITPALVSEPGFDLRATARSFRARHRAAG